MTVSLHTFPHFKKIFREIFLYGNVENSLWFHTLQNIKTCPMDWGIIKYLSGKFNTVP